MLSAGIAVSDPDFRKQIVDCLQSLSVRILFDEEDAAGQARWRDSTGPDLLVLDFSQPGVPQIMSRLQSAEAPVAVIAAHWLGEPQAILTALRLGAREFLAPPLNEAALAGAVRSIENEKMQREARRRLATAVGFLGASGGCGATTIACHLAAELRRSGTNHVAFLDFDLAAGTAGFWFGADGPYSVLDAVHGLGGMDATLWKGLVSEVQPRLDVLAAPPGIPLSALPDARRLAGVLRYARCHYDWVVADLATHLTPLSVALLDDLETVFLVATPEVSSLLRSRRIVQRLLHLGCPKEKLRLLVSRVQQEQEVAVRELPNLIGLPVEAVLPNDSAEVAAAHASGRLMARKSDFGKRVAHLAATLSGKTVEEMRPARFSMFRLRAQEA